MIRVTPLWLQQYLIEQNKGELHTFCSLVPLIPICFRMFPVPQYCFCSPVPFKIWPFPLFHKTHGGTCSPEINWLVPLFPKNRKVVFLCSLFRNSVFVPLSPSKFDLCSPEINTLFPLFPRTPWEGLTHGRLSSAHKAHYPFVSYPHLLFLLDLILYVLSTIFQLCRDGSSWVELVLS